MNLSKVDQALLQLLRAGMYDSAKSLEDFRPLSDADWAQVYAASKRQTVSGVVLHGVSMLPDELMPPYRLLLRWVVRVDHIEEKSRRMGRVLASLLDTFEREGLSPVVQKGHGVARFYSRPMERVCGDIDIYFNTAELPLADDLMRGRGIDVRRVPDGASLYSYDNTEVEHHSSLIQLHSPLHRRSMHRIIEQCGCIKADVGIGRDITVLAPLAELVMINVHIMKHCFGTGMGLRHFCDYALAYKALMPSIGSEQYREACCSLGILRWTDILHAFINTFLPDTDGSQLPLYGALSSRYIDKAVDRLLSMVIEGGNFGFYRNDSRSCGVVKRKVGTLSAFLRHSTLSVRIAPSEATWIILKLLFGQVHV